MRTTAAGRQGAGFRGWPLIAAGLTGLMLLALTGLLWAHYGTAVFYETIVAGLAGCF